MTSPRLVKGGIVQVEPASGHTLTVIALQYNPDSLTRTLQLQSSGGDGGDRSQALRLRGAAVETLKVEAEIDATDRLEHPDQNATTVSLGLHPQIAALERWCSRRRRRCRPTTSWRAPGRSRCCRSRRR